jgi:hypothetical protein
LEKIARGGAEVPGGESCKGELRAGSVMSIYRAFSNSAKRVFA